MEKTGLYGNVYDFSIDLIPVAACDIRHTELFNEKEQYNINVWIY